METTASGLKPWAHGPYELLAHAEGHLRQATDFDKRMAIVSFDNAIEVSITTFLNLHPTQRGNRTYKREHVAQWLANYHTKLTFLDYLLESEQRERLVTTEEIIWYHNLRNELYHSGNGMVPEERSLHGARTAALWVFQTLFVTDPEPLLRDLTGKGVASASDERQRSSGTAVALSAQARLLESYIEMERRLREFLPTSPNSSRPVPELVFQHVDGASAEIAKRAQRIRNGLVHGEPVEASDEEVLTLAHGLDSVVAQLDARRGVVTTVVQEAGWEAIEAAGRAVSTRPPRSTEEIRSAIPVASAAAESVAQRAVLRWDRGRYTGLPIAIYQNELYEKNREWHFTDGTLCVLWAVEFPQAKSDYAAHPNYIASTRTAYNNGRHQAPAPKVPTVAYGVHGRAV